MKFGVSLGDAPHTKSLGLLRAAERANFDQIWVWDSHIIWQEAYSLMGWLIGESENDQLEWGTCVTNPVTRDPMVVGSAFATLNQITGGRVICGIGRGDSSVRVIKRRPSNLAGLEAAVDTIHKVGIGDKFQTEEGTEAQMPWAGGGTRVYVAGYGPKALKLAGRVAEGVIFQIADPFVIEWGMQHVRAGAEEAGRDPDALTIHCAAATFISDDIDQARQQTRWFPAVVGNHIADVLRHHDPDGLPDELIDFVKNRSDYDYREHAEPGTDHSQYITDDIVDRFCVIGDPDQIREKLHVLEGLGVSEFNIYPHVDDVEDLLVRYGKEFAPEFRAAAA
ncbi:MAG TPA: TIGR03842 family LLM class F420-dependent oxidoreductase [Solirubrobacterales bacterium]|jgi:probable F420-dependent oxidoreductase